jgi:hypothetical protein
MSKGIGRLQRTVLETLPKTKEACVRYRGNGSFAHDPAPYNRPGWVRDRGACFLLPDDVFDLLAVSEVARLNACGKRYGEGWYSFQAAFSRAVHGLLKRGLLIAPSLVRVLRVEKDPREIIHHLADGMYVAKGRTIRFVTQQPPND